MAESRDPQTAMGKILSNVEQELQGPERPTFPPKSANPSPSANVVENFAPQKYRERSDTMEQIQQDFRKAVAELEQRFKMLTDELKRITG